MSVGRGSKSGNRMTSWVSVFLIYSDMKLNFDSSLLLSNRNPASSLPPFVRVTLKFLSVGSKVARVRHTWSAYSSILSLFIMLPFKTAEKLISSSVKIDRLREPYCCSHNRAHQASVVLLLLELFSIQTHVICQDLHFFGRNNFHESVWSTLSKSCYYSEFCRVLRRFLSSIQRTTISSNLFLYFQI